ncbi:hypothetical protein LTR35_015043 [Friedmanniomyces endolithicus]|uniref:Uncharacterized protein n=1 Tax=Friedmanniomyces endolithicus TaxID=329885 RepID=A0AAN6F9A0_9PEZI|nr:hypothetical protein LTR35_015043 [Friedmanniomyces endolithicus]KAK0283500.1 hypothetical protein LTS00_011638 [Friedmanniomyces endolithicus]KAK0310288.1 hypothetical protein LTR82_014815 [Friedmanniomyces endolithicus]KAK0982940.1 hypothetical protein LTR54_014505 [Friedmanniomyces endolithicus]
MSLGSWLGRNGRMSGFGSYGGYGGFGPLGPGPFGDFGNDYNRDPFMDPYSNQNNQQQCLEALRDLYQSGEMSRGAYNYMQRQVLASGGGYGGGGWSGNGYGSSGGCPYCQQSGYGGQRFRGLIGGTCPLHGVAI